MAAAIAPLSPASSSFALGKSGRTLVAARTMTVRARASSVNVPSNSPAILKSALTRVARSVTKMLVPQRVLLMSLPRLSHDLERPHVHRDAVLLAPVGHLV